MKHQIVSEGMNLEGGQLPECNLFTLFMRKQQQCAFQEKQDHSKSSQRKPKKQVDEAILDLISSSICFINQNKRNKGQKVLSNIQSHRINQHSFPEEKSQENQQDFLSIRDSDKENKHLNKCQIESAERKIKINCLEDIQKQNYQAIHKKKNEKGKSHDNNTSRKPLKSVLPDKQLIKKCQKQKLESMMNNFYSLQSQRQQIIPQTLQKCEKNGQQFGQKIISQGNKAVIDIKQSSRTLESYDIDQNQQINILKSYNQCLKKKNKKRVASAVSLSQISLNNHNTSVSSIKNKNSNYQLNSSARSRTKNQQYSCRTESALDKESSVASFRAKEMPNFQIPFIIFKSNKPLTLFKEFKLKTQARSISNDSKSRRQRSLEMDQGYSNDSNSILCIKQDQFNSRSKKQAQFQDSSQPSLTKSYLNNGNIKIRKFETSSAKDNQNQPVTTPNHELENRMSQFNIFLKDISFKTNEVDHFSHHKQNCTKLKSHKSSSKSRINTSQNEINNEYTVQMAYSNEWSKQLHFKCQQKNNSTSNKSYELPNRAILRAL